MGTGTLTGRLAAFFREPGSLASEIPQVIKLRTSHMSMAHHFDLINSRRSKQKGTLNTDAVRCNPANCEVCVVAAFTKPYDRPAELLNALPLPFTNSQVNAYIIPRPQLGDIFVYRRFECFQQFGHWLIYSIPAALCTWAARGKSIPRADGLMIRREFQALSRPTAGRRGFSHPGIHHSLPEP